MKSISPVHAPGRRGGRAILLLALACLVLLPALVEAATVTYLIKPAQLKRKGKTDWVFLNMGDQVREGDSIRTGSGGRVELSITPKRQFRIGQATEIKLEGLEESRPRSGLRARVRLFIGRFWGSLRAPIATAAGERVTVATATAVVGVKGTTFGVDHDKKTESTRVAVVTGIIAAMPPPVEAGPPTEVEGPREIAPPQEITREEWTRLVRANQKLIIRPGEVPTTEPLTDEDKADPWVAFNIARDNQ